MTRPGRLADWLATAAALGGGAYVQLRVAPQVPGAATAAALLYALAALELVQLLWWRLAERDPAPPPPDLPDDDDPWT